MLRNHPLAARLLPKLLYQLVPAALVTTVGVLLLSNLTKVSDTPAVAPALETAIHAEAVFKIVPRETEEAVAEANPDGKRVAASRTANPKPPTVVGTATPASRKTEPATPRQAAGTAAPPPAVQTSEPPQQAAATPDSDNTVLSKLRSATTAVQRIPQWATRSVAGWFSADAPPRPPASVPGQNFQAGT